MARRKVTLKDVASVAGVSVPTASKVLNGRGRASEATRRRINEAAERLGFRPNHLGVSLASGRSGTFGVLAKHAPGIFAMRALTGVTTELGRRNLAALSYDAAQQGDVLLEYVHRLEARNIDGLVVVGDGTEHRLHSLTSRFGCPVVYVYAESDDSRDVAVLADGRAAGRLAGAHLLDLGRQRFAHIMATRDPAALDRAAGFEDVLLESGARLDPSSVLRGDWSGQWGARACARLLDEGRDFDALFCGNDAMALGALWVLRERGLRIPDDVAIVGVDDIGTANGFPGGLTSVDLDLEGMGRAAVARLVDALEGDPGPPGAHYHPGVLRVGASTIGGHPGRLSPLGV